MTFDSGSVKRPQAGCDRFYRFAATGSTNCPEIMPTGTRTTRVGRTSTHTFCRWLKPKARSGPRDGDPQGTGATATGVDMTDPYFYNRRDIHPLFVTCTHITLP